MELFFDLRIRHGLKELQLIGDVLQDGQDLSIPTFRSGQTKR